MSQKNVGGNSHDRRKNNRNDPTGTVNSTDPEHITFREQKHDRDEATQRRNELWTLLGIALGCASWGWTVIAPDSSMVFGSILLFAAVISLLWGLWRLWTYQKIWLWLTIAVVLIAFAAFDWRIVVKPQRGKPFRDLLVEGYHLTNECESIPANTQMPTWMRDQSKEWQARTQQFIGDRLGTADAQTWQKAIVVGTIDNEGMNGYQCLWLSNKVAALESIIAKDFDPNVKHNDNIGSIYWLNAIDGKVDISNVFKDGKMQGRVYMNGGRNGPVQVTGHVPGIQNGTITFGLSPP